MALDKSKGWSALVEVLESLSAGRISITEGCAKVVALRHSLGEASNDLFLLFVGVDSETHMYPLGEVRDRWSAAALARADEERVRTEEHYRPYVLEAVGKLLPVAKQRSI